MDLEALTDFVAVVEAGSISGGARLRRVPKQSVSRRLLQLENGLGIRLFERTTRALHLTPEGEFLRERAADVLATLEEARRALTDRAVEAAGPLRISCPTLLGQTVMGSIAAMALARHPRLTLEIVLADRRVSLVEEGYDAAIRVGPADESGLVDLHLADAETIIVAAPSLVGEAVPTTPAELAAFPAIVFSEARDCAPWVVTRGSERALVPVRASLATSSHMLNLEAAKAGAGIARVPAFIARTALNAGQLVRMLPEWDGAISPIRLVYSSRRLESARLRAFKDVAIEAFASIDFG